MAKKSVFLTYLLWLVGGIFGLHHIYLERDAQAFIWWCTLGGYIGCGWLRDIFHIPEYVAEANNDEKYTVKHVALLRSNKKVNIYKNFNVIKQIGWSKKIIIRSHPQR